MPGGIFFETCYLQPVSYEGFSAIYGGSAQQDNFLQKVFLDSI